MNEIVDSRFEHLKNETAEFQINNGLVLQNVEEQKMQYDLYSSAVSLSTIWQSKDNTKKLILWDKRFEEYLAKRARVIKANPMAYMPWNIMTEKGIILKNGYSLNQSSQGTCAGAANRNCLTGSDLVNAKFADYNGITETGVDMVYALARGNGRLDWGAGCNGTPLVKFGTEIGNYRTDDIGKYDPAGRNVTKANFENPVFKENALLHQSICCYLPDIQFETFFKVGEAGLSTWIGSSSFPGSGTINDGVSRPTSFSNGAHATCIQFGIEELIKLLFFNNSHGDRYAPKTDKFNSPRSGVWVDKEEFQRFRINPNFGIPFVCFGELIAI